MTNQKILEKAIRKATNGGWGIDDLAIYAIPEEANIIIFNHNFAKALWGEFEEGPVKNYTHMLEGQVFNTLIPDEYEELSDDEKEGADWFSYIPNYPIISKGWKAHLQQMVIASDPITYLGKNI